jgi:hypothetical protein
MSHLSILPTVLRDPELLVSSLEQLGFCPLRGGLMRGFADEPQPVDVQVGLPGGESLGWRQQADGSLALVGDLQRISRSRSLQALITRLTRCYAARLALQQAGSAFAPGTVSVHS